MSDLQVLLALCAVLALMGAGLTLFFDTTYHDPKPRRTRELRSRAALRNPRYRYFR